MEKKEVKLEKNFIRSTLVPKSYDDEKNTVDVVFSEGSRGLRWGWSGRFYEELAIDKKSVRLERMNTGAAPALKNHNAWDVENVIGIVENARIEGKKAVATIRFSNSEKDRDLIQKIKDGIVRNVSVGYNVHKLEKVEDGDEQIPVYRATDWEPLEVSFVAIPFDAGAQVRSGLSEKDFSVCEIINSEGERSMAKKVEKKEIVETAVTEVETAPVETPAVDATQRASEGSAAPEKKEPEEKKPSDESLELARVRGILDMARNSKLSAEQTDELITRKLTIEQARDEIKTRWAKEGNAVNIDTRIEVGDDKKRSLYTVGVANAILHRQDPMKNKLSDEGREFRGQSLLEMGCEMLEYGGVKTRGLSKSEKAGLVLSPSSWTRAGFHTTSDFPHLLADAAGKMLRQAYEQAPQTWRPFTRVTTAPDFKDVKRYQLGEAPSLDAIGEHGEVQFGTMGESKEVYAIASYGKAIAFTRKMLINDDLDAFMRVPRMFGMAAANKESDLIYAIFTSNAAMSDSIALFHSSHGNTGTGALSDTSLTEMRKKGRLQTGIDGATLLNIFYKHLIVPAALEVTALKQLALVTPNQTSGVNVFANSYNLIVEPRLDSNSAAKWYGAADYNQIDTIEAAYLEGEQGVRMEQGVEFDIEGVKMKALLDFGCKAIDHRGLYQSTGV